VPDRDRALATVGTNAAADRSKFFQFVVPPANPYVMVYLGLASILIRL